MNRLYTAQGRNLPTIPWDSYPRPQMVRRDWLCLNGKWKLEYGGKCADITVPFCPESLLSGVDEPPTIGEKMLYSRAFTLPDGWDGRRVLLHFGAVSREVSVFVNGKCVARHGESYLPFTADISGAVISGENELRVEVVNDISHKHAWGKQSVKRGGMWYTPCSGIWQSVWLESVPEEYIRSLSISTGANYADISVDGPERGTVIFAGRELPFENGKARINVEDPVFWSPENPHLYDFEVRCGEDAVSSYFALRTLCVREVDGIPRLCLNGEPYFFNGLLDQGYWSDGLYTPADPELFENDIISMKELGFNTLRKHIKIEPEQFYYACDRLGMIVFQDMVNFGEYRYIRDTVLPTLHFQRRKDTHLHRDMETRQNFLAAMDETVRLLKNHPCICLWTIFNEGWGQFLSDKAYTHLKALDPSRFIDSTSGWFHQRMSDVDSLHIYFDELHLGRKKLPQLLSEFGGYSYKIPSHSFNLEKTYGYRKYERREDYVSALKELYGKTLPPLVKKGLCGAIYTQVSDVEDETNGLVTFDRAEMKVYPSELRTLNEALQGALK